MSARTGLLLLEGALVPGRLVLEHGRIARVERLPEVPADAPVLAPGLIDLHVHGYAGFGPEQDLAGFTRALATAGTTACLPTLFPDAPEPLGLLAQSIWERREESGGGGHGAGDRGGARVLGLHLEGPFVNPRRAGGLPAERLHAPSPEALRALLGGGSAEARGIRQLTLAPELPGALALIRECSQLGIRVSLGHSTASASEASRAADSGARGATHLFNAMNAIHHREATLASFALAEDALVAEIIGDLVHVGREAFRIALRARGPLGLALVSDALRGAPGLEGKSPEAEFESHGRRCRVRAGAIWLVEDDPAAPARLTGAEACQLEAVRRLVRADVLDLATALTLASESPARALGLEHQLGRLVPGAHADLIALDRDTLALREVLLG